MGFAIRSDPLLVVVVVVRSARPCSVASLAVTTRNEWILGLGAVGAVGRWKVDDVVVVVVLVVVALVDELAVLEGEEVECVLERTELGLLFGC